VVQSLQSLPRVPPPQQHQHQHQHHGGKRKQQQRQLQAPFDAFLAMQQLFRDLHAGGTPRQSVTPLDLARNLLEKVKAKHPSISYADLYTLAGVVAVQAMGGPTIPWRAGRTDAASGAASPPDGRLPDATTKADHLRDIFHRMGFSDQEIVALSGAHALGRCHTDRSGFSGPWTHAPTTFSNEYFKLLLSEKWVEYKPAPAAPLQYADAASKALMMLPSDMALLADPEFNKHVE
jgi:cytochrome c peroxidase